MEGRFEDDLVAALQRLAEVLEGFRRAADAEVTTLLTILRQDANLDELLEDVEPVVHAHSPAGEPRRSVGKNDTYLFALAVGMRAKLYEGTKHSRATDLLLKGVPERVLQALLSHRDVRSTRRYARLDSALVEVMRPRGSNVAPRKTGTKNVNKNK